MPPLGDRMAAKLGLDRVRLFGDLAFRIRSPTPLLLASPQVRRATSRRRSRCRSVGSGQTSVGRGRFLHLARAGGSVLIPVEVCLHPPLRAAGDPVEYGAEAF